MPRVLLSLASLTIVLGACEDDDENKTVPDTMLDDVPAAISNQGRIQITFHAVGVANNFQCRLDGATPVMCIPPFEADVTDGEHTFEVAAALNQNVDATPAMVAWRTDTAAPDTTLVSAPPALDNATNPMFAFTGADPGTAADPVTFECSLEGGAFAACATPHTVGVGEGGHRFAVRAKDRAGNVDPSPASHDWTVDLAAPETVITSGPAAGSTSAPSGSFAFDSPEPGATFDCALDTGVFAPCTSPFAFTLPGGNHLFEVRARDASGSIDPSPAQRAWTVDATPPDVALTGTPANPSNDATPQFAFASSDPGATFECRTDAGTFAACTTPFTTAALGDGSHTFRVRAVDGVGNVTPTPAVFTWSIDTAPPTVTITVAPAAQTNDTTPSVTFTTAGAPTAIACQVDAGGFAPCTSPFTASAALGDGPHSITVRATDAAGNLGTDTASFTVDTVPPTVTITAAPPAQTNDTTPSVTFTTAGAPTAIACQVDAGGFAPCTSPFTSSTLASGPHTITVRATDAATNAGTDTASFTVDTTPPTISITVEPAALSNDTTPSVTFTAGGGATATECRADADAFAPCTSPFTAAPLADGNHTISVRARDAANNTATDVTASFAIDTVAPTVTITAQPAALSNDATPSVSFTTTGSPTTTTCQVDTDAPVACTSPFTAPTVTDGTHTITVRVADGATNASTATTMPFAVDTAAPTLTLTETPPAAWPVDYFDLGFTVSGATVVECRVGSTGSFTPCTSPHTVAGNYGAATTVTVRARDAANNQTTQSTTWTPNPGLVLHYPWEQGSTANTSLLAQVASHSPHGSPATLPAANIVGGWAGTAIAAVPAHKYVDTARALSSSPDDNYTVSLWIRSTPAGTGTLINTIGSGNTGGFRLSITQGSQLRLDIAAQGSLFTGTTSIALDRWVQVALRTTGAAGMQLFLNGQLRLPVSAPGNGFGAGQIGSMDVGTFSGLDLDDLRFHNRSFTDAQMCTVLARGTTSAASGQCIPLSPGIEIDFERGVIADTGAWKLPFNAPQGTPIFVATNTGNGMQLPDTFAWGVISGLKGQVQQATAGRSFALWFRVSAAGGGLLWDTARPCVAGGPPTLCGIRIVRGPNRLDITAGTTLANSTTFSLAAPTGVNSLVVTERRQGATTVELRFFINGGAPTVVPFNQGDIYEIGNDSIQLVQLGNQLVDEYELWPTDLARDPEILCENGFDGEHDPATGVCSLTTN